MGKGGKSSQSQKYTPMTQEAAARIQSIADKYGNTSGFKERAQRAAAKNEQR